MEDNTYYKASLLKKNRDGLVLVDTKYHWNEITESTPRGVKLQLINKNAGSAAYGTLAGTHECFWTHWAALPTFRK